MSLPLNEKTFSISVVGQFTKIKYEGNVTFLCKLSMIQKYTLELEKSRLMSDVKEPTPGLENITNILCNLKLKIIKAPDWWKDNNEGFDMIDDNVILELYEKSIQAELDWEKEVIAAAGGESEKNPT